MLHIPPMTQLAWPGEHQMPVMREIDARSNATSGSSGEPDQLNAGFPE